MSLFISKEKKGFQFENAEFWNVLLRTKMLLAQMNSQLGQCKQGTFEISKLFLDRTFPLSGEN